jgi:hypothetical protein
MILDTEESAQEAFANASLKSTGSLFPLRMPPARLPSSKGMISVTMKQK